MKMINIKNAAVPVFAQGCMRIDTLSESELENLIQTDIQHGINFFDHADIYGGGICEAKFGNVLKRTPSLRDNIIIQSKCGIHRSSTTHYDFSKQYIIACVHESLSRLHTSYLDYLILHRPDALMEPKEIQEAFHELYTAGKVKHFGVSNHNRFQMEMMQKDITFPLEINQMQMSVLHTPMIDAGLRVNTMDEKAIERDNGTIEYCRLHDITMQCWSPYQYGMFEGVFLGNKKFPEVNAVIDRIAHTYGVQNTTIATSWLLRHPANMQVIYGSVHVDRIADIVKACDIRLTREEWYEIYVAAGNMLP